MKKAFPTLSEERKLWQKGYLVIGIDEVGRGAFAGHLVVGGVIFAPSNREQVSYLLSLGINDSKKLKPRQRQLLSKVIQKQALGYHISKISVAKINKYGIGKATFMAMRDTVKNLREKIMTKNYSRKFFVLIDKFYVKHLRGIGLKNQKGIIHGDEISLSIAAASIIAKVARDKHMIRLSAKYKGYGWGRNKGYGTIFHQKALAKLGPSPLHRISFIQKFI